MERIGELRVNLARLNETLLITSEDLLFEQKEAVNREDQWQADTLETLIQNIGHAGRMLSGVHEVLSTLAQDAKFQWSDEQ